MASPATTPEKGISIYQHDDTQGPKCAIACPAGTFFRNYFLQESNKQVNTLMELERVLENDKNKYWYVKNGYCFPKHEGVSMKELS